MPEGALYFEQTYFPFTDENGPTTIPGATRESMWHAVAGPPGPWVNNAQLREGAKRLRQKTDKAILGGFGGNLLETGQFFYRNDNFFMLLAAEPAKAHKFLDDLVEIHLANLEKYLGAVGDCIDLIKFGDDLGMQSGPQVSPKMYREFFKPRHKLMWSRAKQLANVKVMLHCCGGVRELLPDLIDAGLEAINPVQISCAGMDARELKAEFGKDMVFWGGGCDTQTILPNATPDEVRRHVKEQVQILSPGGGFVFQQVHNILANVPPENIVAMYEAVQEIGRSVDRVIG
jgi:uroporphyrinogen decarboxylase